MTVLMTCALAYRCLPSYSGERCQFFTLSVGVKPEEGFSRTTALAVVAVVLSTLCLTIIGLLLALRYVQCTHTHRHTHRDRQTDRQTDSQIHIHTQSKALHMHCKTH